jgi:serine/threonine protein kinase/tetratricopeptide (TPR) repeat protein
MSGGQVDAKAIFLEALDCQEDELTHFVEQACGSDRALRTRVEELLRAHRDAGAFLGGAETPDATCDEPIAERPGTVIGPYKLLEQIGEGGFGVVFMAEQTQPVRRRVALKVLKPGMDTRQVVARFEAERQALALMDHPNIAQVFDGGETTTGRPYFVMELVRGVPITEFCDQSQLPVRQRLELFGTVCQAVQHAHQKGIIHRDLKPSNILVTMHDDKGVVKVIDFGIAKATGQQLTDKTLFTHFAQWIGTPLYMSPEQTQMSGLDIDTRSDIYSLGVLLYELLSGTTPFDEERLRTAGYDELRRIIREEEPLRPSMRISTLGLAATTVSANRRSDPRRLSRLCRRELDWIVMKCLEKDRNRRYETASGLAVDVRRYLENEPVQACPPSLGYRLRKFVRRHRAVVWAASVSVLTATLAFAGSLGWMIGERTAQRAVTAEMVNDTLEGADGAAVLLAERKWPQAEAAVKRAEGLLAGGGGDPELHRRVEQMRADLNMAAVLEEILLSKSALKDGHFDGAQADRAYAVAFRNHGIDAENLAVAEAADRIRTGNIVSTLAAALDDWAMLCKGIRKESEVWKHLLAVARLADDDPWRNPWRTALEKNDHRTLVTLAASAPVADLPPLTVFALATSLREAGAFEEELALLRRAHEHYPGDFWINHSLGFVLCRAGAGADVQSSRRRRDEGLRFYMAAAALRPQSPIVHLNIGNVFESYGLHEEAIAAYQRALHLRHDFAEAHRGLGIALQGQGRLDAAIAALNDAIRLKPSYAPSHDSLGNALYRKKNYDAAIVAFKEAVRLEPNYAHGHISLGMALMAKDQGDAAVAAFHKAVQCHEAGTTWRSASPQRLAVAYHNIAIKLTAQGKLDAAIDAHRKSVQLDPDLAQGHFCLGIALHERGLLDPAIAAFKEVIRCEPGNPQAYNSLGVALRSHGQVAEAIVAFNKAIRLNTRYAEAYRNLSNALDIQGKLDAAIAACRDAIYFEPTFSKAHYNLGILLSKKDRPEAAIAAYDEAIRYEPNFAEAHCNKGQLLRKTGQFTGALAALRRGDELGSRDPKWKYQSAQWLRECEREVALDGRLPAILKGTDVPADAAERIELAGLCVRKQLYGAAAQFYETALTARPDLAANMGLAYRYQAACAAAQAGCGQGKDVPPLDAKRKAVWRSQALDWLRTDLAVWTMFAKTDTLRARSTVQRVFERWQREPAFAALRGDKALATLAKGEQDAWRALWAEAAALLKQTIAKSSPNRAK